MFGDNDKSVNLRITMGVFKQFETETQGINDLLTVREGNLLFAPPYFFNSNVALNTLPVSWLKVTDRKEIKKEDNLVS